MPEWISKDKALQKLQKYCAYQDRCHQEVRSKLISLGIYGDDLENIIVLLIEDNFLNEERFAQSYARGKFRMKKWGRVRIKRELKQRKVSDYCIRKGMAEIEEDQYLSTLIEILQKRQAQFEHLTAFEVRKKMADHAIRRGYEVPLVWDTVKELVP